MATAGVIDGTRDYTKEELMAAASEQLETKFGFTTEELETMTEFGMLKVFKQPESLGKYGVTCSIADTCTATQGRNLCHLLPGETTGAGYNGDEKVEEVEVGWIVRDDPELGEPSGNWNACMQQLMCPVVYDTPKPAVLEAVTTKEFE